MKGIKLNHGQVTLVDDKNFERLNQWKWYAIKKRSGFYAVRGNYIGKVDGKYKTDRITMHRLIMGVTDPKILVDHKDHNGLNNQEYNLRQATTAQNCSNQRPAKNKTSKFLGVSRHKETQRWVATAGKNKKSIYVGLFKTQEEAALAYNAKALELHGEFANLNQL